jgi:hypothetical protein
MEDLVNKLRCYAEDLHSAGGFNGYASAMSLAADEIVKMREYVAMMDADMIATIEQRDALQLRIEEQQRLSDEKRDHDSGSKSSAFWGDREDIIRMARKSGAEAFPHALVFGWGDIERFAALVAAAEREACAIICDVEADEFGGTSDGFYAAKNCAAAIRDRFGVE